MNCTRTRFASSWVAWGEATRTGRDVLPDCRSPNDFQPACPALAPLCVCPSFSRSHSRDRQVEEDQLCLHAVLRVLRGLRWREALFARPRRPRARTRTGTAHARATPLSFRIELTPPWASLSPEPPHNVAAPAHTHKHAHTHTHTHTASHRRRLPALCARICACLPSPSPPPCSPSIPS